MDVGEGPFREQETKETRPICFKFTSRVSSMVGFSLRRLHPFHLPSFS